MRMRGLLATAVSLLALAIFDPAHAASQAGGQHPRIVMVVAPKDFTDQEYADPRSVFDKMGAMVRVASTTREPAIGHSGARAQVDLTISELKLDQFDALVIVGGTGALTYLMDNEALRNLIVAAAKSGKVVAGICVAPAVLAHAGVLRNREATCYPDKRCDGKRTRSGPGFRASRSGRSQEGVELLRAL